ncbi:hypothetical protein AVEN_161555-1 [Araneus ventricosus]|uniref:PiggyBac transposable element-derived protein domain-containing protein n=1 Tax=Araneus ventricosus TaxID=182803 RepID=A0A4Y2LT37_ARAVE|nr:hypothetical protein AVEN_161555-1 [Araneus ventricosus]
MDRGASDRKFDVKNEIAAVRWNDNRVVSVITNFEDTRWLHESRKLKCGKQKVDVPSCVFLYNKYKNVVDLFDNHMETYFLSIQGKKWYWPLFINAFETSLVAAWKLKIVCSKTSSRPPRIPSTYYNTLSGIVLRHFYISVGPRWQGLGFETRFHGRSAMHIGLLYVKSVEDQVSSLWCGVKFGHGVPVQMSSSFDHGSQ